jgi:hypothetical protein
MDKIDFKGRINASMRYHTFWVKSQQLSWIDAYSEVISNHQYGLAELLTLIHPKWYTELGILEKSDPRVKSNFDTARTSAFCRSNEIWGYECPYSQTNIEIDHIFPYSRGGSTTNDNAMYLCKEHNRAKSNDVHLLPWEKFVAVDWIRIQFNFFVNRAQNSSKDKIYLPRLHLKRV